MEDSQSDSKFFSVRIVSIDYYMAAPLPGFDICYSSFQGGRVNGVPVIRVYGATPAGQKTCLHLHGVKCYLVRQWKKIILGRVSLQDFVFAKEVRLGTYSAQASSLPPAAIVATKAMRVDPRAEPQYAERVPSSLPPAAIIATKAMRVDPRTEPQYAERVPYVVVHGEPGARLADVVVDPLDVLSVDSPYRLNDVYYIKKQIIPALQRVFGLVRADLNQWFSDMPRTEREAAGKRHVFSANAHRTRIDYYYLSKHCIICGKLIQASSYVCQNCSRNEAVVAAALTGRTSILERNIQHLAAICGS